MRCGKLVKEAAVTVDLLDAKIEDQRLDGRTHIPQVVGMS
jgi:hypothetical protein